MKLHKLLFFGLLFTIMSCNSQDSGLDSNETLLSLNEIPAEVLAYKETHFPDNNIIRAIKEVEVKGTSYELYLEGRFELEFNDRLEIVEIDGVTRLPDSVIQQAILDYASQNYAGFFITDWELEGAIQTVELNNGIELEFDLDGNFIRVDD